jgi:hypothetical protein
MSDDNPFPIEIIVTIAIVIFILVVVIVGFLYYYRIERRFDFYEAQQKNSNDTRVSDTSNNSSHNSNNSTIGNNGLGPSFFKTHREYIAYYRNKNPED